MENQKKLSTLNIVGIILIAVFLPIIMVNLTIVVKGWTNPDEIPMIFDTAPLIVISDSMTIDKKNDTGAFNKGDLIFIKKVDPATLQVGDIITYISNDKEGSIITHRIVSIYEDGTFETKGDYSPGYDRDPVTYEQVVGKYSGRIARAGDLALFFQKPVGVIVLLGVPLVAILAIDFFQKRKETDKVSSEKAELEAELAKLRAEKEQLQQAESTEKVEEENADN
ncbi:MAG: signal peptidase I [Bacilli bacterium]|nr:signal peptidase I [Bacilli bacterium]